MKKFIVCALIAVSALSVTITSCNKYPDGPKLSLLTKKMRITGNWTLDKYLSNGADQTSTFAAIVGPSFEYQIVKDGTYKELGDFPTISGTWAFSSDKTSVTFTPSSGSADTFKILKLESKSLWFQIDNSNGTYDELHLKQ